MASVSDLKPPTSQDNTDPDEANEKSIMNLLLAAAAKCKNHQPNGMVKAASTSELEASNSQSLANDPELEPVRKNCFGVSQCGNFLIFLSLRFFVKSI